MTAPTTNRPHRSAWILGACLTAGAVVFGVFWWSPRSAINAIPSADTAALRTAAHDADASALTFGTRLLPDGDISASPGSVRVGLAYVSPDEAAAYRAWLRGGGEGAGPRDLESLASVTRWLNLPATLNAQGVVVVTPTRLPAADRYVLQARADDGLRFYEASFTRDDVPTQIGPRVAAGLRLRAPARTTGSTRVLFRRVDGSQDAAWQSLMRREAPAVLDAYDERALRVTAADVLVAPLPPGPLDVVAVVGGIETERRRVTLSAGRITTFDLDADASELGAALSVTAAVRLVEKGSGSPVKDATVVWSSPRGEHSLRTDASGMLRIPDVDPLRPLSIDIRIAPSRTPSFLVEVLPSWPERLPMTLDLADDPVVAGVIAKTVELEPLRWLIVDTPGIDIPRRPRMDDPFPVFVLQHRQGATWHESSADYFRPVAEGLAVSLNRAGSVRVAAVLAPWTVHFSDAVEIGEASSDARYRARISGRGGRRVSLRIDADVKPLAFAPVHLLSPLRGVPTKTLTADRAGQVVLDNVTETDVLVEVPGFEQVRVMLDSAFVPVALRRSRD